MDPLRRSHVLLGLIKKNIEVICHHNPCKVLMKLLIYQNSYIDFERSYAFLYIYKQLFSGERPRAPLEHL